MLLVAELSNVYDALAIIKTCSAGTNVYNYLDSIRTSRHGDQR